MTRLAPNVEQNRNNFISLLDGLLTMVMSDESSPKLNQNDPVISSEGSFNRRKIVTANCCNFKAQK